MNNLKKSGVKSTIATSQNYDSLILSFERLNLKRWFELKNIVYNDGTYPGKPNPDSYILAAKKINFKPIECIVFEDAINGIQSAYSAGVRNIIAVGNSDRLKILVKLPGVIRGVKDFSEANIDDLI